MTTKPYLRSMMAAAACLCGVGQLCGCASRPDAALSEDRYRVLYPREYYNSLDSWHQQELDQQALRDQVDSKRK